MKMQEMGITDKILRQLEIPKPDVESCDSGKTLCLTS